MLSWIIQKHALFEYNSWNIYPQLVSNIEARIFLRIDIGKSFSNTAYLSACIAKSFSFPFNFAYHFPMSRLFPSYSLSRVKVFAHLIPPREREIDLPRNSPAWASTLSRYIHFSDASCAERASKYIYIYIYIYIQERKISAPMRVRSLRRV